MTGPDQEVPVPNPATEESEREFEAALQKSRRALQPLREAARQAEKITGHDWNKRFNI